MGITITRAGLSPLGGKRPVTSATGSDMTIVIGRFTFGTSYPSGGESLPASAVGLKQILFMAFDGASTGVSGIRCEYDYTNRTVKAFGGSGVSDRLDREVPNGTNLSWATVRFIAVGQA